MLAFELAERVDRRLVALRVHIVDGLLVQHLRRDDGLFLDLGLAKHAAAGQHRHSCADQRETADTAENTCMLRDRHDLPRPFKRHHNREAD